MGGYMSHATEVGSPCPASEERRNINHFFDPRSPSTEITRTPIMVAEPVFNRMLDPRSPSEAIDRTPISYQLPEKFKKPCNAEITDKISPLCFDDDMDDSKSANETDESSLSFVAEAKNSDENNDAVMESDENLPVLKTEKIPREKPKEEMMPSPILPLIPNEHYIDTPRDVILPSTTIPIANTTTSTDTASTDTMVTNSKIPTCQTTKILSAVPRMMSLANTKKRTDLPSVKAFGWKKSGDGRSPLLSRNGVNQAFSPLAGQQSNALSKIQPNYRQSPLSGRGKDVQNVFRTNMQNKENVTIMWED